LSRWLGLGPAAKTRAAKSSDELSGNGSSRPTARRPACDDQPLVGRLDQPQPEGHRTARQVIGQPPHGFQLGLLDDIRGIDPRGHLAVHPHRHDLPQIGAMPVQEPFDRLPIAAAGLIEQPLGLGSVGRDASHRFPPSYYPRGIARIDRERPASPFQIHFTC
jgi:hypothetical protein